VNYWKGLLVAVVLDVSWIMGNPSPARGPEPSPAHEPYRVMNPEPGVSYMPASPEDAQLDAAGRLEYSLMVYLHSHDADVATMVNLARMYVAHGWYDAAIGPLARAAQLDPERRAVWSLLDRALKMTGKTQITDAELLRRAEAFVEAVGIWGDGC